MKSTGLQTAAIPANKVTRNIVSQSFVILWLTNKRFSHRTERWRWTVQQGTVPEILTPGQLPGLHLQLLVPALCHPQRCDWTVTWYCCHRKGTWTHAHKSSVHSKLNLRGLRYVDWMYIKLGYKRQLHVILPKPFRQVNPATAQHCFLNDIQPSLSADSSSNSHENKQILDKCMIQSLLPSTRWSLQKFLCPLESAHGFCRARQTVQ